MRSTCWILFAALAACAGDKTIGDTGATDTGAGDADTDSDTDTTGDTGNPAADLVIVGTYLDDYGSDHVITNERWTQTYSGYDPLVFDIVDYDNLLFQLIAQNSPDNAYFPELWSRFDWLATGSHLYVCQSVFDAETEQIAHDAPRADDADPATGGCGGGPWTDLTP